MKIKTHDDHSASDAFWLIIAIFVVSMIVGVTCYGIPTASASQPVEMHRINPVYSKMQNSPSLEFCILE